MLSRHTGRIYHLGSNSSKFRRGLIWPKQKTSSLSGQLKWTGGKNSGKWSKTKQRCVTSSITAPSAWGLNNVLPDGLFSLGFPDFGLLVPLGNNVLKGSSNNGPLELVGPLCSLLGGLLLLSLLVLATVQDGPVDLAGIALQQMGTVGATIQEFEGLK